MAKEDLIEVCPNCGHKVQEKDRMEHIDKLYKDISGLEYSATGRIICPDCNFSGLPVKMAEQDLKEFKFQKKEIGTKETKINPNYPKLMFALLLIPIIFIIALLIATQYYNITFSTLYFLILILIYLIMWIYVFIKVPMKHKE